MLVKGVVHSGSGEAYRWVFITAFSIEVVVTYLPTLAPIGIDSELRSLRGRFGQSVRVSTRFSSKSNDR